MKTDALLAARDRRRARRRGRGRRRRGRRAPRRARRGRAGRHPRVRGLAARLQRLVLGGHAGPRRRAARRRPSTRSCCCPATDALLAPAWVPWDERVAPGDLSPGDLLPADPDDPRLVPAYVLSRRPGGRGGRVRAGLGRERVMSRDGRLDAADRWQDGDGGPDTPMARQAPAHCGTCGFLLPLAGVLCGRLRRVRQRDHRRATARSSASSTAAARTARPGRACRRSPRPASSSTTTATRSRPTVGLRDVCGPARRCRHHDRPADQAEQPAGEARSTASRGDGARRATSRTAAGRRTRAKNSAVPIGDDRPRVDLQRRRGAPATSRSATELGRRVAGGDADR